MRCSPLMAIPLVVGWLSIMSPPAWADEKGATVMLQLSHANSAVYQSGGATSMPYYKCKTVPVTYLVPGPNQEVLRVRVKERICAPCKVGFTVAGFGRTKHGMFYNVSEITGEDAVLCRPEKPDDCATTVTDIRIEGPRH